MNNYQWKILKDFSIDDLLNGNVYPYSNYPEDIVHLMFSMKKGYYDIINIKDIEHTLIYCLDFREHLIEKGYIEEEEKNMLLKGHRRIYGSGKNKYYYDRDGIAIKLWRYENE